MLSLTRLQFTFSRSSSFTATSSLNGRHKARHTCCLGNRRVLPRARLKSTTSRSEARYFQRESLQLWRSPRVCTKRNCPGRVQEKRQTSFYRCTDASAALFQQLIIACRRRKVSALTRSRFRDSQGWNGPKHRQVMRVTRT